MAKCKCLEVDISPTVVHLFQLEIWGFLDMMIMLMFPVNLMCTIRPKLSLQRGMEHGEEIKGVSVLRGTNSPILKIMQKVI